MTAVIRSAQRTSYPALMLFGIVYLAALAIVVTRNARADRALLDDLSAAPTSSAKETP